MYRVWVVEQFWGWTGRILAGIALLLCLPLLLLLALLVKLSGPGPVLHVSLRLGQGGRSFRLYKFRSMRPGAEDELAALIAAHPERQQAWEERGKLSADPRVTAFGRFLRRSSLDEVPQLFNILKGDMHWVGPRPILAEELCRYGEQVALLHSVKPGLTGLWQVSGRSSLSYAQRVELDLQYIRERSPALDLKILAKTLPEVFKARGAC
jgi:exopolysaccharide production protein ExoY